MEFPTALLGVALGAVLDPAALGGAGAPAMPRAIPGMLDWGLRLTLVLALPCTAALLVFPEPMLASLFQRGAFGADDVAKSAMALARLRHRPARHHRREDPGAGLLCAPGHPHTGDHCRHRPGLDAGDERALRALPRPRRAGVVGEPGSDGQRRLALRRPAPRQLVPAGAGLGSVSRSRSSSRRWRWAPCSRSLR